MFSPPLMRAHRTFLAGLLLSASLASAQTATPPADMARAGTFKQLQGEIRLGQEPGRAAPAPGDALRQGDRVRTGPASGASIVLKDGTVLTMGPNTTVDLGQFQFDSTTQSGNFVLDLLQGSVRVVTGLLAKANPERFKVRTPTSVVGVRGTDFIVEAIPQTEPLYYYLRHHWKDHSRLRR
ncbi:MAG: FecR domain-containing protein [Hydrogenophaga sp.]|uniref:FecR family protein n=1 Tax=Hydrogenophaga sp. TaxID=1904254 RepID=UPI0025C08C35|nr:FecR family protein [Hydrogenophaga sp.]MBT9550506.1 FecR domain-containing protein [Hydrogenophaga sp.]